MEECESLDSEMAEMQEFRPSGSVEALGGPDDEDEDEVEELRNSLREVVQDPSVRPSVQCLLVDPSFSMVTVQSEDSGIVWETASSPSRCSTPGWASESCSSVSEGYSMGDAGKITIIFDQDKVVRRRTRSGSRSISSRLSDRFRRTSGGSSSRCGSVLGVEKLEMAEVSVPNVRAEGGGGGGGAAAAEGPDLEEIRDKDQQLFSLISDGYEILNIRVPSKLPTVDEEESTELPDNLSYMETHPGIRSRPTPSSLDHRVVLEEEEEEPQDKEDQTSRHPSISQKTDGDTGDGGDMDYMEKFSLLDQVVPAEEEPPEEEWEDGREEQPAGQAEAEAGKAAKEACVSVADSPAMSSDDSFVFVTDADLADDLAEELARDHLAGDHLDEVFYGNGLEEDTRHTEEEFTEAELEEMRRRSRRESQKSVKESGSRLFGSEETVLTPIYLPEGPPKIIDQILLDEPTALSFMYTDLYEEAMGERRKSEERLEAESVAPERRFRRRLSEGEEDEANGSYLEMFTLRDDLPHQEDELPRQDQAAGGSMMGPASVFEMTGCLQRVEEEEEQKVEEKEKVMVMEAETEEEVMSEEAVPLATGSEESDRPSEPQQKKEDAEHKEKEAGVLESRPPTQTQEEKDEPTEEAAAEVPVSAEVPQMMPIKTHEGPEDVQVAAKTLDDAKDPLEGPEVFEVLPEEATPETAAAVERVEERSETAETPTQEKEAEAIISREEVVCTEDSAEADTSTEAPVDGEIAAVVDESLPPVITDSEPAIQEVAEVMGGTADETLVQTQVRIVLPDAISEETPEAQVTILEEERQQETAVTEDREDKDTLAESSSADVFSEPVSEAKTEPLAPEEVKPADVDENPSHVAQSIQSTTDEDIETTELIAEAVEAKTRPPSTKHEEKGEQSSETEKKKQEAIEEEAVPLTAGSEESDKTPEAQPDATEEQVLLPEARPDATEEQVLLPEARPDATEEQVLLPEARPDATEEQVLLPEARPDATEEQIIRVAETDHAEPIKSIADKVEVKTDETGEKKVHKKEDAENKEKEAGVRESQPPSQRQKEVDKTIEEETAAEVKVSASAEVPQVMLVKTDEGSEEVQLAAKTLDVAKDSPEGAQVTALSEEAAPEPEPVAAVENVEKLNETLAVEAEVPTPAKEPEAISQEEVICTEAMAETEISTEAPVDGKKETTVAETLPPVEVITDSEPAIQAVVEVIEGVVDETQTQTQVQIALREVITEETPEVESSSEDVFPEPDSEAKTEPLVPEEVKPADVDETPSHVPESILADEEAERTELAADDSKAGPPETVSVGEEIIVLVPKGKAVEMDIEIGQLSYAVARHEPESAQEALVSPDATSPVSPPPQALAKDSATEPEPHVDPSEENSVAEMATEVIERWPSPPAPVKEEEEEEEAEAEEKISDLEEDEGGFRPLRSFTGQEDLSALITEPSGTEERKDDTSGVTDVPQTDTDRDDTRPEIEMHETPTVPHTEDHAAEQMKDDVGQDVELRTENEGQEIELHMEVLGNATELHQDDVAPETETCRAAEDIPETDVHKDEIVPEIELLPADVVSEDVGQEIEIHEVEISPEIKQHTEDVGQETELHEVNVSQESKVHTEDAGHEIDLHKVDEGPEMELRAGEVGQEAELQRDVSEAPRVVPEELGYEVISQQEAKEVQEPVTETRPEAEEPPPDLSAAQDRETETEETKVETEEETKVETKVETEGTKVETEETKVETEEEPPSAADEELVEEDYDIIDAEEESQARAAAELQGMDWFCVDCGCLLSQEQLSGAHKQHRVTSAGMAYDNIKERLGDWISELQARSENIEDLVSELEMSYNTVEEQCAVSEESIQKQNEEMMALVMDQYNTMSLNMEEEKKSKLEQLYDQIVSFQESIDSAKVTLDTTSREAETEARSLEDIETRLKAALNSAMSLELGPRGLLVFEDYTKKSSSSSSTAPCNSLPVPQKPSLVEQEAGSASSSSVTVYWRVNPGDIIDCFQVYCMEEPQGAVSEEYRVTVKESFCVLEELEADKTYKVWAMAVNATGCSLPSDRLVFRTAPSVPVIQPERCSVLGNWATLRWTPSTPTSTSTSPSSTTPPLANTDISYTLEYCRQYELEGEGLRSISGIRATEQAVLLQPNEKYLFYIKAVNPAGASEQSEAALISTKSSRFHLLETSSHPSLELSDDHTTVHLHHHTTHTQCPSILGELLPARGCHYWETNVAGSPAYRVGVAYETANRDRPLGEDSSSWCLHCVPTASRCRLELLNAGVQCAVFVVEVPQRLGVLLDHPHDSLSFYNAQTGQLLGTMSQRFSQPCHPALGLEAPGSLEICMVQEVPEFTKRS